MKYQWCGAMAFLRSRDLLLLLLTLILVAALPNGASGKLAPPVQAYPIEGEGGSDEFPNRPSPDEPNWTGGHECLHVPGTRSHFDYDSDLIDSIARWMRIAFGDWSLRHDTWESEHGR